MDQLFSQFGINIPLLLAQILNFGILILVLGKFVYRPILNILDKRRERIEHSLQQAKEIEERTKKMEEEIVGRIADAKKQSDTIIGEARQIGEKARNDILIQANKEVSTLIQKAKEEIEREKVNMMTGIEEYVIQTSMLVVEKILADKLDTKVKDQLVHEALQELPQKK